MELCIHACADVLFELETQLLIKCLHQGSACNGAAANRENAAATQNHSKPPALF